MEKINRDQPSVFRELLGKKKQKSGKNSERETFEEKETISWQFIQDNYFAAFLPFEFDRGEPVEQVPGSTLIEFTPFPSKSQEDRKRTTRKKKQIAAK